MIWNEESILFHLFGYRRALIVYVKVRHDMYGQPNKTGDEPVAFSVALRGTPPFSFTYTRSEIVGSKMKVVETQVGHSLGDFDFAKYLRTDCDGCLRDSLYDIFVITWRLCGSLNF
jgi:hypothetical protein